MNILITGDSHLASLDRALENDPLIMRGHNIKILPLGNSEASHAPYFVENSRGVDITLDRFQNYVRELPPKGMNIDVLVLSMPFHTIRIAGHSLLWRKNTPHTLDNSDKHTISYATFKHMVLSQQSHNLNLLAILAKSIEKVIVIEGPRLFSHHRLFGKVEFETAIEADKLYRRVISDALLESGIPVVRCPSQTYDPDNGLMKDEFKSKRAGDQHHANSLFSTMMLRDLIEQIESLPLANIA